MVFPEYDETAPLELNEKDTIMHILGGLKQETNNPIIHSHLLEIKWNA